MTHRLALRFEQGAVAGVRSFLELSREWPDWGIFAHTPHGQPPAAERRFRPLARPRWNRKARPKAAVRRPRDLTRRRPRATLQGCANRVRVRTGVVMA